MVYGVWELIQKVRLLFDQRGGRGGPPLGPYQDSIMFRPDFLKFLQRQRVA